LFIAPSSMAAAAAAAVTTVPEEVSKCKLCLRPFALFRRQVLQYLAFRLFVSASFCPKKPQLIFHVFVSQFSIINVLCIRFILKYSLLLI
jgi:hypothetical protein